MELRNKNPSTSEKRWGENKYIKIFENSKNDLLFSEKVVYSL